MAGQTSSLEQLQGIIIINNKSNLQQQQQLHGLYLSTTWSIELLVPASLVLCWRNMTTEYSSLYKVGLIDVGTEFAQSRPVWSAIAYGKLKFRGTVILLEKFVANANLAPHQSAQVIIQCGTRYVDFFSLLVV